MMLSTQLVPTAFALGAVLCWGTSDFLGGYAAKRSDAFLIALMTHCSGSAWMVMLALAAHAPQPSSEGKLWSLLAGALGGAGLAMLYRALSGGMGLTAPLAAVVGAAVPTGLTIATEGAPGILPLVGFGLAGIGIWLISRPEQTSGPQKGLWMAALAGAGFAGFFLCIHRAGSSSALWASAWARFASFFVVAIIVLARLGKAHIHRRDAMLGLVAGLLDVSGTALFIRADQTGRLDAAVVLSSLYPALTVLLARFILKEHFTRWKAVGILAALLAVPLIALR